MMTDHNNGPISPEDEELSNDLAAAIEQVRVSVSTPEMIDRLTNSILKLTTELNIASPRSTRRASRSSYWMIAVAASVVFAIGLHSWVTSSVNKNPSPLVESSAQPRYSPITTVSYKLVGYHQVEHDLDRADSLVETVSEGLALASVRHEIQETLDEFYDWSK